MIFTKKRTYKQHDNEKDSFYKFSAKKLPDQSKITESFSTDICIIGAGLTGISSALHLSNNGLKITILEANKVGAGASGRNGGQLGIGMRKDQFFLEKKFGFERAKFFWNIGCELDCNIKLDLYALLPIIASYCANDNDSVTVPFCKSRGGLIKSMSF